MEGTGAAATAPAPKTTWLPTDLLGALALARRSWLLLVGCGIAGLFALLGAAVIGGPSYTVGAKILVNLGPEMVGSPLLAALQGGPPATQAALRPEGSTTGVEIFTNPRLIREVVDTLGEDFFADQPPATPFQYAKFALKEVVRAGQGVLREALVLTGLRPRTTRMDRLVLAIGAALTVEPVRRTDIIDLTLRSPDPRAGEAILGRFIELALADHVQAYQTPGVAEFLDSTLAKRREELAAAQARLLALRTDRPNPVWSVPEQRAVLIRSESELQQQLRQEQGAIAASQGSLRQAEATLAGLPADIELSRVRSRNSELDALRSRLVQLRLDRVTQEARYGADSPEIADNRRQTETLIALIEAEPTDRVDQVTTGLNQLRQSFEREIITKRIDLEGQLSRARQLGAEIERLRAELRDLETAAIDIAQLEQTVARATAAIDLLQRSYDNARIAETMASVRLSGLSVVMPPTAEIVPSAPSLKKIAVLGLVAGLGLGLAIVLFREFRLAMRREQEAAAAAARGAA